MAAVIRSARLDPERLVLASRSARAAGGIGPAIGAGASALAAQVSAAAAAVPVSAEPAGAPNDVGAVPAAPPGAEWRVANGPPLAAGLVAFDPETEARALRERLVRERDEVLAHARDDGYAQGIAAARSELDQELAAVDALLQSLRGALVEQIGGAEDLIVEIAFEAICKILGDSVADRAGAVATVREVLRAVAEREQLVVRVAPGDYELLLAHRTQLLTGDDGRTLDIVPDERVTLGGCLVETSGGTLDGRLETQLARLIDMLATVRRTPLEPAL